MSLHVTKLLASFAVMVGLGSLAGCDLYFGPHNNPNPDAPIPRDSGHMCEVDQDCVLHGLGQICRWGACYRSECLDPSGLSCHSGVCGDWVQNPSEVCDDGNQQAGDGCSADCTSTEVCGNGIVDAVRGEQCDDGNANDTDECTNNCRLTVASCAGEVTCTSLPPTCTTQEVPLLANGCYTGACRLITVCDVPPACGPIRDEAACLARTDCEASYTGRNCQHPDGSACRAGDSQCVCESFTFAACAPRS